MVQVGTGGYFLVGSGRVASRQLSCHVMSWQAMSSSGTASLVAGVLCKVCTRRNEACHTKPTFDASNTDVHYRPTFCRTETRGLRHWCIDKACGPGVRVNRFRRGRGVGRGARGHQLETQFACKNRGFMQGDPYLPQYEQNIMVVHPLCFIRKSLSFIYQSLSFIYKA